MKIAPAVAAVSLLACHPASAQSVEEFYKSRAVTIMVGFNVGNIYDTVMRTVARHIGKHIPGNPTVIPVNRPGAGSLAAANQVFNASPRDGTVIGVFNRSIPTEPLLGSSSAAKFDATKFTWIGNVGNEVSVCVARQADRGPKTWHDFISKPMQVAVTSTSADTGVYPLLLNNMFGAKLKLVTGYQGGADMTLALERGEVDGRCGWSLGGIKTARPAWLKDGPINYPGAAWPAQQPRSRRRAADHGPGEKRSAAADPEADHEPPGTGLYVCRAAGVAGRQDDGAPNGLRPDHEGSRVSRRSREEGHRSGRHDRSRGGSADERDL